MGKLIVIEGVDSSGKQTQTEKLYNELKNRGYDVMTVAFPNYKSKSSELVKMYLGGEFGDDPEAVNPYTASAFFAVDRVASYKLEWQNELKKNKIIIADRYTTSNMIHQASKIDDIDEKNKFLDWVYDFEYNKLGLPEPDVVVFLDMPVKYAKILMASRPNKIDNSMVLDIHEGNEEYLNHSYNNAVHVCEKYNWLRIKCVDGERIKSIDEIAKEIINAVEQLI